MADSYVAQRQDFRASFAVAVADFPSRNNPLLNGH